MSDVVTVANTPVWKCCTAECDLWRCFLRVYRPHREYSSYNVGYWFDVDYCYEHCRLFTWSLDQLAANMATTFWTHYYAEENYLHWSRQMAIRDKWDLIQEDRLATTAVMDSGLEVFNVAQLVTDYAADTCADKLPCFCNLHLFSICFIQNKFLTVAERGMCSVMFLGIQNPVCFCLRSRVAQLQISYYLKYQIGDSTLARFRFIHESGTAICGGEHDIEILSYPS